MSGVDNAAVYPDIEYTSSFLGDDEGPWLECPDQGCRWVEPITWSGLGREAWESTAPAEALFHRHWDEAHSGAPS